MKHDDFLSFDGKHKKLEEEVIKPRENDETTKKNLNQPCLSEKEEVPKISKFARKIMNNIEAIKMKYENL